MAMVQLKGGQLFPVQLSPSNVPFAQSSLSVNASDFASAIFIAQKSGTLETIEFMGSGTSTTFRISVQAISATSGDPSGTDLVRRDVVYNSASAAWQIPGKMTSDGTNGGTPLTLVKGDKYFVKLRTTAGNGTAVSLRTNQPHDLYSVTDQGAGNQRSKTDALTMAIRYSDGTFYAQSPFSVPAKTISSAAINSTTTPDEVGMFFSLPTNVLIGGISWRGDLDGDAEFRIYDSEDIAAGPLRTVAVDKDIRFDTGEGEHFVMFSDLFIAANHRYIATVRPTTSTSITPASYTVNSAAMLALMGGSDPWSWVERTDLGNFAETTTKRPLFSVFITGLDQEIGGSPTTGFEGEA